MYTGVVIRPSGGLPVTLPNGEGKLDTKSF
jgi:hypothetical protein